MNRFAQTVLVLFQTTYTRNRGCWIDPNGLIGFRQGNGIVWWRWQEPSQELVITGTTKTPGKSAEWRKREWWHSDTTNQVGAS